MMLPAISMEGLTDKREKMFYRCIVMPVIVVALLLNINLMHTILLNKLDKNNLQNIQM